MIIKEEETLVAGMRAHVADLLARSPWYKRVLREQGVDVKALKSMADIHRLPFTTKQQLTGHNAEFLCVAMDRVVDHVFTSGSTGAPMPFLLSEKDLDRLSRSEAASLASTGIGPGDIVQITTTLDKRFMAGIAYWLGLRRIGTGIVRTGPGNTAGQWETAESCGTTALITVPSFLLRMLQDRSGNDSGTIRKAICIGEPITDPAGGPNKLAKRIMELCNIQLHGTYASTEMATACTERTPFAGHEVPASLILIEVLDDDDQPVPDGGIGEVVATPLGVEAMPLLRFRTGDICSRRWQQKPDGSLAQMLGPVIGRKEQRMKVKGTTLYPQQVIDALNALAEVNAFVILRERDVHDLDVVRILLDADASNLPAISERLSGILRVIPTLERTERKVIEALRNDPKNRKPTPYLDRTKT